MTWGGRQFPESYLVSKKSETGLFFFNEFNYQ